ncbi:hypothetical protein [Sulfurivirga sp.]|uniref:hypothetical protein n=1 Tax=Sulfurivirga sp. TaxID=2614236 RepID=UPI0025FE5654|nr:hypothetical protein [Sulfurivirga sp.]
MDEFITQKELAAHFGLTKGYISQLVRRGVLDGCRKGGKFVRLTGGEHNTPPPPAETPA